MTAEHKPTSLGKPLDEDQVSELNIDQSGRGPWRLVAQFGFEDFGGFVAEDVDGAVLHWSDYVANDWTEAFPTTAQALGRLGLLVDGANRGAFFQDGPEGFATTMQDFFEQEAQ